MATSKKTKKEEDKKESFDLQKAMDELAMPNMFKAGLGYYIENHQLTPKTAKEFDKIVRNYSNLKMEAN